MISIPGIKLQDELERLPYFNKETARVLIGKTGRNLDKKISALLAKGYFIPLKKGLYVTAPFVDRETDRTGYLEYLANVLRYPSYISLEYVLTNNGLIPEAVYSITSITLKTPRVFQNGLGNFIYRNIKESLFFGFDYKSYRNNEIKIAGPAKALFDFLYLKKRLTASLKYQLLEGLRINWDQLGSEDRREFTALVQKSNSQKMGRVLKVLEKEVF